MYYGVMIVSYVNQWVVKKVKVSNQSTGTDLYSWKRDKFKDVAT